VGRGELVLSLTGGWATVRWPGIEAARWWSGGLSGGVLRRGRGELGEGQDAPGVLRWGFL
jgi:hypothetical protein